jgi:hypothetical protein
MKHRDRVQTVLHCEIPDRCPMQISFTPMENFMAMVKTIADTPYH